MKHAEGIVQVFHLGKAVAKLPLSHQPITVGCGDGVNLLLPPESGFLPLHFSLEAHSTGCSVRLAPGAALHRSGKQLAGGLVPWQSVLEQSGYEFHLKRTTPEENAPRTNPMLWIALLAAVPLVIWLYVPSDALQMKTAPAFELDQFNPDEVACPNNGPVRFRAERLLESAIAKEERYLFEPHDGVEAVSLYAQGSACLAASGEVEEAKRMEKHRKRLLERIKRDFTLHQVKLNRALEAKDYREARQQATALLAMVKGTKSDYSDWLIRLEKQLGATLDQEGE